jgi:predicted O-methyltransferase YrrM
LSIKTQVLMDKNNDMEKIYEYIRQHATRPSEALAWVEKQTHIRTNHARMLSGAVQGQILRLLVQTSRATRILELGTFTGYSAICLASALPEGGHLDTLEINDELEDLILEGFERAGLDDKIELHIGDCKETLRRLRSGMGLDNGGQADPAMQYDIVYMDANKREYCEYYELIFDMVRPGGLILADNVLWDGKVCEDPMPQDKQTLGIARFNDMVSADPRVESVILPLRDGLNLIRRKI